MINWHALKEAEVLKLTESNQEGLNKEQIQKKLQKYGKNELIKIKKFPALKIFLRQFTSVPIIMLIIAAIISAIVSHWIDFYVIMGIVLINGILGFVQEYKAERAIENLKSFLVPKATVLRGNKIEEIDARELVPGDILILNEGDRVMADARVISFSSLQANEAALTGESAAVDKNNLVLRANASMPERVNMVYQGTEIVKGNCRAVVVATGMKTEYGKIALLVQQIEQEDNPFKKKLDKFGKDIAALALVLTAGITLVGIITGFGWLDMFFIAISLAVAIIPEGLPAVVTLSLAFATQFMIKQNTLVRKLPSAETLGRTTVICTDKTGTITAEKMQVKKIYVNGRMMDDNFKKSEEAELLFKIGVLCNNARIENEGTKGEYLVGDPTEKALLAAAQKYGINKQKETIKHARIIEFGFNSARKMMSIVRQSKGQTSYVKGAPEIIISRCKSEFIQGKVVELTEDRKKQLVIAYERFAGQGMRVLGFAYKTIIGKISEKKAESNLTFVGMQAMIDPPRKEVREAIKISQEAGIRIVMITGDSLLTAIEVGKQIGLKGQAITSSELKNISNEELKERINKIAIFARVSPEDKLRIVNTFRENNEIIAVTGDGINDAPALKRADIGIAVNRGTDVAKDSSDMILIDNNFASIPKAVREGRRVYDNVKKFVKLLLATNFYEIMLLLSVILIWRDPKFLPLLPIQILWMNLVTDTFPALALSQEQAEDDVMRKRPDSDGILQGIKAFVTVGALLVFAVSFLMFYLYMDDISKARTMAVTTGIIFVMLIAFSCKSDKSIFKSKKNNYLIAAVAFSIFLHLVALYTPVNTLLQLVPLSILDWAKILGLCIIGFMLLEGFKVIELKYKRASKKIGRETTKEISKKISKELSKKISKE